MDRAKGFMCIVLVIFLLLGFLAGCGPGKPKADGGELYTYITQDKNYKDWKMWPGRSELYPGTQPHGAFLTTYVTDEAFSAIQDRRGKLPESSIIVKENYTNEKSLDAIAVMYKVKGYDAANNNWFWAKYRPDGAIDAEGKVEACISCHGQKKDNDYIFTSDLK